MPAITAAPVHQPQRMRICLQPTQHTLTRRGKLRFPQTVPTEGELQIPLRDVLKLPPISQHGNMTQIIGKFGGAGQLRSAKGNGEFHKVAAT